MKWPFLNRLRTSRASRNLENAKSPSGTTKAVTAARIGKMKKPGTRRRHRQIRLLDLFCSVRNRTRLRTAPSCCSDCLSDRFTSQDFPILRAGYPDDISAREWCKSSVESLSELVRCHSLALHCPIPGLETKLSRKECPSAAHRYLDKNPVGFSPCYKSQEKCGSDPDIDFRSPDACLSTNRCPRLESYNPSFVASTPNNLTLSSYTSVALSKYNAFDQICLTATESVDSTIYSAIADESDSISIIPSSDLDAHFIDNQSVSRPKLIGSRRTCKAMERTYDVIDPDTIVHFEPFRWQSSDREDCAFETPWMASTLKRTGPSGVDQETLYDEVASETDEQLDEQRIRAKVRSRRRYPQHSPSQLHDPVKRVRREYFVYEE
ncbi:hypothetical protein FBUS_03136 [Fasciolopsis buskii]|uniref:Uncharacterized protein n=1 Tax=Fasciolopsis buskii TaxID=27845 RepID=A0A8E0S7T2_9TREM|nr:hypothetical protein FBUS_03136 [Fasciolopsis buski]